MDEQIRPINSSVAPTGDLKSPVPATRADLLLGRLQGSEFLSGGFKAKAQTVPAADDSEVKRGVPLYNGDSARNDTPAPPETPKPGIF